MDEGMRLFPRWAWRGSSSRGGAARQPLCTHLLCSNRRGRARDADLTQCVASCHVVSLVRGELKELAGWGDGALLKRGAKAPNIPLAPLEKKGSEHLADFAGKIVVLEFWSIGRGPCQGRMANLQCYPDKYPEWTDRVVLIGACSVNDLEDAVIKHVKAKGWDKIHNVRISDEAMRAYHVNALPTHYVIDQRGEVVDSSHVLDVPTIVNRLLRSK
jgi:AhpC/TSA family